MSLFVEQKFDWKEILDLHGVEYNFGTCQRGDGSFYGHGGQKCHQGVEASPETLLKSEERGSLDKYNMASADLLTGKLKQAFPEVKPEHIDTYQEALRQAKADVDSGNVTEAEIKDIAINADYNNPRDMEFVFIGMEPGLSNVTSDVTMAEKLATQRLINSGELTASQARQAGNAVNLSPVILQDDKNLGSGNFVTRAVRNADEAMGGDGKVPLNQVWSTFNGQKVGSINMANFNAVTTSDGKPGKPFKKGEKTFDPMDPKRSEYGLLASGRFGPKLAKYDRNYVKKNFEAARAKKVAENLVDAANNGKLKGGFAAPGSTAQYKKYKETVLPAFEKAGRPVYQTSYTHTTKGGKSATHEVHVVDLGKGKHIVSASFSINRYGYDKVPNQVYRQAIKEVKTGSAKPYNNAAEKDLRDRIKQARQDGRDGDVQRLQDSLGAL